MEITIFPARGSASADTVVSTPSQGVATITIPAVAAPALSAGCSGRSRSGHRPRSWVTAASARSNEREPNDTSTPA